MGCPFFGAADRIEGIKVLPPSSRRQADVHRTSAFLIVRVWQL